MATTYGANTKIQSPALADRNWHTPLLANHALLDGLTALGGLCVTLTETPSTTLNVKVSAGDFQKTDGTVGTYAGTASQAITTATTKYLYLDNSATLTIGSAWPSTTHVRLAVVVAGATTITSVTDARVQCIVMGTDAQPYLPLAGGTLTGALTTLGVTVTDASNVVVGSTTGTKIGTATTQKLGFWNSTAIVQPSGAGQATVTLTASALTNSTTGSATGTIGDVGGSFVQATLNDIHSSLTAAINKNTADVASLLTLVHAIRTALVDAGLMKGSA